MIRPKKHIISLILIPLSILLLVASQVFWLKKVYEEQRVWLRKEADNLFHQTISTLQDSIFQSKIIAEKDSCDTIATAAPWNKTNTTAIRIRGERPSAFYFTNDSPNIARPRLRQSAPYTSDSKTSITAYSMDGAHLQNQDQMKARVGGKLFSIPPDSIQSIHVRRALQQVILTVESKDSNSRGFMIKIDDDSLATPTVQYAFDKALQNAGMPIGFDLMKFKVPNIKLDEDKLIVGPLLAGVPPRDVFAAELLNYESYLFQKILPQLLFSIFLIGITSLAFWLIFRSLRQQQRLAQLKNDFISNVTHELKTPIATVSVAIEALNNFNALQNPQLTREYLDISKNELNRLNILVDKVLKMAIFEQGEPELRTERFDFREVLQQIVDSMKLQFEKYAARVDFDSIGADFTVQGDMTHLTSVVYNLIDNALKYSKEEPEINIKLEQQNGQLTFIVQDNGIGIAPEHQARIFEKFYRVTSGDVHNTKGHGLGLSYVANVVKKHGGSIAVASELGRGSCFTVHLPRGN